MSSANVTANPERLFVLGVDVPLELEQPPPRTTTALKLNGNKMVPGNPRRRLMEMSLSFTHSFILC